MAAENERDFLPQVRRHYSYFSILKRFPTRWFRIRLEKEWKVQVLWQIQRLGVVFSPG